MPKTYLTTPYLERLEAKDLGARWDGSLSKWYVPEGCDLAPFSRWLPSGATPVSTSTVVAPLQTGNTSLTVANKKGVSLSSLLTGVSHAVAQAYKSGVWTIVEVVELRTVSGHVFMGVSERDAGGIVLAKTNAVIWQSTAISILPEFERATGAVLASNYWYVPGRFSSPPTASPWKLTLSIPSTP